MTNILFKHTSGEVHEILRFQDSTDFHEESIAGDSENHRENIHIKLQRP